MYLSKLKIWNFRKYGGTKITEEPALIVNFNDGLNVLVGENDSGKSTIIDAIKQVLLTQSHEYIFLEENDFFQDKKGIRTNELKIECFFNGFKDKEAANFLEWANFNSNDEYELQIRLISRIKNNRIIADINAGIENADSSLDGDARNLLRVIYLKPLRDAENELTPGRKSRLAQILKNHSLFIKEKDPTGKEKLHQLELYLENVNKLIEDFFVMEKIEEDINNNFPACKGAKEIGENLNNKLKEFFPYNFDYKAKIKISNSDLIDILHRLSLFFNENKSGLGALNLLFITTELLLSQTDNQNGLKLTLIEELEAHLHPQAQLRVINFLQNNIQSGQYILTTHSITLASSIKLKNLIICNKDNIYPMGSDYTKLDEGDYQFLERFLDATKANLFFARGVIIVEGDAENLIVPTIAEIIDRPLYKYGVSIVNVGSTALLRYSKIFLRKDENQSLKIPISIITDLDIKPEEYYNDREIELSDNIIKEKIEKNKKLNKNYEKDCIKAFISPEWTLEYVFALSSLNKYLYQAILYSKKINNNDDKYPTTKDFLKIEEAEKQINIWIEESKTNEQIAYEIYKPLLNKNASKAVTAQIFAKILEANKIEVKNIIEKDVKIKYLKDAIYYVTELKDSSSGVINGTNN